jgi:hypothetical protein
MSKLSEETKANLARAEWVREAAKSVASKSEGWAPKSRVEDIQLYVCGYAEPGYSDPPSGVIATANWNTVSRWDAELNRHVDIDKTMPRVAKIFETMGVGIEWSDEWTECTCCWGLLRTSPDSYSWSPSYVDFDGERVCLDCIDPEEHLSELEGEQGRCNTIHSIDPTDHGYRLVNDEFENGFHRGQDASPAKIAEIMRAEGFERFLFNIEGKGQFDIRFGLYLHDEEAKEGGLERAQHAIRTFNTDGPSNSDALRRGLMEASRKTSDLRAEAAKRGDSPPGIIVAKVGDGGAEVKEVSVQDFIEGKALD